MWQRRWLQWTLLIAFCVALGFIDALRSYFSAYYNGAFHLALATSLRWDLTGWSVWVLFIPLMMRLSQRWRIGRGNWQWSLPAFLTIGLLMALTRTFFPALVQIAFIESFSSMWAWMSRKPPFLITDFLFALVFYGLVLAFGQALAYHRQYREEELRASRLETQLAQAQLAALKMQLHPHFLFNTLHSISSLQLEDAAAAQKMTARLGDFLRLTLDNAGVQETSLRREIEFLRCYLDIERVRFGQRLTTEIEVEPEALEAQVPNLILQPLVENAIRHGIAPRAAPGRIRIRAEREGDRLKLAIRDNGGGLPRNGNGAAHCQEGLGLQNTRARLQQLYGADFGFELRNATEGGLVVMLDLPLTMN